ncbi:hypothetical protein ACFL5S_01970 [Fibrobacterota bacterium]
MNTIIKKLFKCVFLLTFIMLFISCTATRQVRTIGKGNKGMEVTLGGPLFTNLGPPLPMPNFFIGGRYGLLQDLDIAVHYNLTAPIIPGIPLDLITGIYWVPIQPGIRRQENSPDKGWGVGGSFALQWITDFKSGFVALPAFELAGGWRYKWINPFVGMALGLNFYRPHDNTPFVQVNPFLGTEFIIGDRAGLSVKCTFFDIAYNLYGAQVDWVYVVDDTEEDRKYGVFGIALGFSWDFGRSK